MLVLFARSNIYRYKSCVIHFFLNSQRVSHCPCCTWRFFLSNILHITSSKGRSCFLTNWIKYKTEFQMENHLHWQEIHIVEHFPLYELSNAHSELPCIFTIQLWIMCNSFNKFPAKSLYSEQNFSFRRITIPTDTSKKFLYNKSGSLPNKTTGPV